MLCSGLCRNHSGWIIEIWIAITFHRCNLFCRQSSPKSHWWQSVSIIGYAAREFWDVASSQGARSRLPWMMEGQGCWKTSGDCLTSHWCYWLDNDPTLEWGDWILSNSFHFLLFPGNTSLLFSMYGKYFPHDLVLSPFLWRNELLPNALRSIFIPLGPVFHRKFSQASYSLLILAHFQTNIFTMSRNSIWAPASISFSTIAKCPSKHALWRAVRLYCENRDLRETESNAYIKMSINPFYGMKLGTLLT